MFFKPFRHNYRNFAACKLLFQRKRCIRYHVFCHNAFNPAKVIYMRMRNNNRFYRIIAQIFFNQFHGRLCTFYTHERIKQNPAGIPFYHGKICHIITAHLINPVGYFKQSIRMIISGVFPQAWIYGIRCLFIIIYKGIGFLRPDNIAIFIFDFQFFRCINQPFNGKLCLLCIFKVQHGIHSRIDFDCLFGSRFRLSIQPQFICQRFTRCIGRRAGS